MNALANAYLVGAAVIFTTGSLRAEQPQMSFTQGSSGTWNADWAGLSNRTYFFQWSLDLVTWQYAPFMEFGTGIKSRGIATQNAPKFFVRLKYVDETWITSLQQAKESDIDLDGIPNLFEVETVGSDPFDKNSAGGDVGGNGLPDGWEIYYFGGVGIANPNVALQPDGLTNKEKAELGLSPNVDYSASSASAPAKYNYDLVGRLTVVTAPIGAGTYTPDEEGNLLDAQ